MKTTAKDKKRIMAKAQDANEWVREQIATRELYDYVTKYVNIGVPLAYMLTEGFAAPLVEGEYWIDTVLAFRLAAEEGTLVRTVLPNGHVNYDMPEDIYSKVYARWGNTPY